MAIADYDEHELDEILEYFVDSGFSNEEIKGIIGRCEFIGGGKAKVWDLMNDVRVTKDPRNNRIKIQLLGSKNSESSPPSALIDKYAAHCPKVVDKVLKKIEKRNQEMQERQMEEALMAEMDLLVEIYNNPTLEVEKNDQAIAARKELPSIGSIDSLDADSLDEFIEMALDELTTVPQATPKQKKDPVPLVFDDKQQAKRHLRIDEDTRKKAKSIIHSQGKNEKKVDNSIDNIYHMISQQQNHAKSMIADFILPKLYAKKPPKKESEAEKLMELCARQFARMVEKIEAPAKHLSVGEKISQLLTDLKTLADNLTKAEQFLAKNARDIGKVAKKQKNDYQKENLINLPAQLKRDLIDIENAIIKMKKQVDNSQTLKDLDKGIDQLQKAYQTETKPTARSRKR